MSQILNLIIDLVEQALRDHIAVEYQFQFPGIDIDTFASYANRNMIKKKLLRAFPERGSVDCCIMI
jgi:hypothetical protein